LTCFHTGSIEDLSEKSICKVTTKIANMQKKSKIFETTILGFQVLVWQAVALLF
jgi:hypothetical protein